MRCQEDEGRMGVYTNKGWKGNKKKVGTIKVAGKGTGQTQEGKEDLMRTKNNKS